MLVGELKLDAITDADKTAVTTYIAHINSLDKSDKTTFQTSEKDLADNRLLQWIIVHNQTDLLNNLSRENLNLDALNQEGQAAVHFAAQKDDCVAMRWLLDITDAKSEHRADIFVTDKNNLTPFSLACQCGHLPIVEFLWDIADKKEYLDCLKAVQEAVNHNQQTVQDFLVANNIEQIISPKKDFWESHQETVKKAQDTYTYQGIRAARIALNVIPSSLPWFALGPLSGLAAVAGNMIYYTGAYSRVLPEIGKIKGLEWVPETPGVRWVPGLVHAGVQLNQFWSSPLAVIGGELVSRTLVEAASRFSYTSNPEVMGALYGLGELGGAYVGNRIASEWRSAVSGPLDEYPDSNPATASTSLTTSLDEIKEQLIQTEDWEIFKSDTMIICHNAASALTNGEEISITEDNHFLWRLPVRLEPQAPIKVNSTLVNTQFHANYEIKFNLIKGENAAPTVGDFKITPVGDIASSTIGTRAIADMMPALKEKINRTLVKGLDSFVPTQMKVLSQDYVIEPTIDRQGIHFKFQGTGHLQFSLNPQEVKDLINDKFASKKEAGFSISKVNNVSFRGNKVEIKLELNGIKKNPVPITIHAIPTYSQTRGLQFSDLTIVQRYRNTEWQNVLIDLFHGPLSTMLTNYLHVKINHQLGGLQTLIQPVLEKRSDNLQKSASLVDVDVTQLQINDGNLEAEVGGPLDAGLFSFNAKNSFLPYWFRRMTDNSASFELKPKRAAM